MSALEEKHGVWIEGMDGVIAEITKLSDDRVKRREILKILKRQIKPIQVAVAARASALKAEDPITVRGVTFDPGNMAKSIKIFAGRNKLNPAVFVGPAMGAKKKNDGFYARWIIRGSAKHPSTKFPDDFIEKGAAPLMGTILVYLEAAS